MSKKDRARLLRQWTGAALSVCGLAWIVFALAASYSEGFSQALPQLLMIGQAVIMAALSAWIGNAFKES